MTPKQLETIAYVKGMLNSLKTVGNLTWQEKGILQDSINKLDELDTDKLLEEIKDYTYEPIDLTIGNFRSKEGEI